MKSFFVDNKTVKIHVLENGTQSSKTPSLLVIGGLWEPAERAIPVLSGLGSHVVALSLRGRGLSSTPAAGYDLDDHLSDIDTVVKHCQLQNYCVLGFSRGGAYALGWSLKNQQKMRGLIIVDQPAVHVKYNLDYVEYWSNLVYLDVPILNFMRRQALEGLASDAHDIDFSPELSKLQIPVTLFVGRNNEAKIASNISDEILKLYTKAIPSCEVVEFFQSGHMIPDEEQQKYITEIASFIRKLE
ncbi:alpha/beta hydrolase [Desulfosporosinus sp. PR]|uniref:alpha/beta fold hydrolase n=1 Tax=Candidatus Desulfosporosinus nitrosoreducens TaxID=3401928 RepID=UPI0027FC3484|nr:alpha/beta hydrolase [Desulfosporosinus sp. PR]MDQ7094026.1 alpha/beta hydrolase [Desulfosporosinus sp. PR]